ncbi:uncharacterized protein BT62DRAFT_924781 [Guyanagaster necrorhizus]|uniref:Uncharacterized protein n=1 Tax=Guyanagaster necrorhizus TaxID=856835 RepID=A0A9P8AKL6_9AGAR|nr:uncharacterized protein BT62DRAFT_924781 [Guyanagaster necrorhizus MCA 3950]KAG7439338.1 hypothetical protein BT62DRAFT_924781 [Guyanagaster necrorhizus MCA 3950]
MLKTRCNLNTFPVGFLSVDEETLYGKWDCDEVTSLGRSSMGIGSDHLVPSGDTGRIYPNSIHINTIFGLILNLSCTTATETFQETGGEMDGAVYIELEVTFSVLLSTHERGACVKENANNRSEMTEAAPRDVQDNEKDKTDLATPADFTDRMMEMSSDPSVDEFIYAEWNDECIEKHFPVAYATVARYIPNVSEMPGKFWILYRRLLRILAKIVANLKWKVENSKGPVREKEVYGYFWSTALTLDRHRSCKNEDDIASATGLGTSGDEVEWAEEICEG